MVRQSTIQNIQCNRSHLKTKYITLNSLQHYNVSFHSLELSLLNFHSSSIRFFQFAVDTELFSDVYL